MSRKASLALALLLGILIIPAAVFAQGRIVGQVIDATTGEALPGANVVVENTTYGDATDLGGNYTISNVPSGPQTLTVNYMGFESVSETVSVQTGMTVRQDFELNPMLLEGEEVIYVGGQRTGQARALNQQRTANNVRNVVASDQIGAFPDPNTGEALRRIPGVGSQPDQGETRFVTIRGSAPSLNTVLVNGAPLPSPEGDAREIPLDVIPADIIGSIEVSKTLTPDMDANSIGGSVDLVTRSALDFNRDFYSINLGGGYNILGGMIGQGSFTAARRMQDNFGIILTGSYYRTQRGSDNVEIAWDDVKIFAPDADPDEDDEIDEQYDIEDWELRDYMVTRTRAGLGAQLDYAWNDDNRTRLNVMWSMFGDQENRRGLVFGYGDYRSDGTITDTRLERTMKDRYEEQRILSVGLNSDHTLMSGLLDLELHTAFSRADWDRPEELNSTFRTGKFDLTPNHSNVEIPRFSAVSGDEFDYNDTDEYEFDEIEYTDSESFENEFTAGLNLRYHLNIADNPGYLQAGFRSRMKTKETTQYESAYGDARDDEAPGYSEWLLSQWGDNYDTGDFLGGDFDDFDLGVNIEPDDLRDWFDDNKNNDNILEEEVDPDVRDAETFTADETINAAYLMASLNLGLRWNVIAGARMEATDFSYDGNRVVYVPDPDDEDEAIYDHTEPVTGEDNYTNILPSLHVTYRFDDQTNFRFAYSTALARPNYFDLVPYQIYNSADEEIEMGNPELSPATAMGFDLMAEHYFQNVGVLSGGFFMKNIDDYIYSRTWENAQEWEVTQPVNADETGSIFGFELAWNQRLTFLPGELDGMIVYANFTYCDSKIDLYNEDGELRESQLPGQSETLMNFALGYEKYGFSCRLSANYNSEQIKEVGNSDNEDEWIDDRLQLDFSASYRIMRGLNIYLDVVNITNEPYVVYVGDEDHPIQREFYSWWSHLGLQYTF